MKIKSEWFAILGGLLLLVHIPALAIGNMVTIILGVIAMLLGISLSFYSIIRLILYSA